tara:strand:- start:2851 stop:3843 length:993 start_codon:yes stop_codon:yes gene_type:complete
MKNKTIYEKLDFLQSFTNVSLSKDGVNACIWCPYCKHPNKSKLKLVIHLEKNFYHCWVCDKKGSNVNYLISKINKNKSLESERFFKKRVNNKFDLGININSLFGKEDYIEEDELVEVPNGFKLLANAYNAYDPDARDVFKYAIKRGANKHKFWMLRLGYSLDENFRRCLILPSLDDKGEINFFTARKIDVSSKDSFKYKNSNNKKSKIIFNEINIDWSQRLTIVEGPLDLLKTNDNATCLLGSSLTQDMKLFSKIVENKTPVALALDSDVYNKTLKIAKLLSEYDIDVNIVDTRGAEDVGDMSLEQFEELLDNASKYKKEDSLMAKISML